MKIKQSYRYLPVVILFALIYGLFELNRSSHSTKNSLTLDEEVMTVSTIHPVANTGNAMEEEEQDGIREAQEYEFKRTYDKRLGYVPRYKLAGIQDALNQRARNSPQSTSAFTWTERGPNTDFVGPSNGNGRVTANQVTAGRLRTIWVDLIDGSVWTGGVDGGIWKTTNIVTDPTPWSLVTDMTANIAIASITQSPVNTQHMYFGTGEKSANADAVRGGGVWKSTDHGVNWTWLSSTANFWNVSKVICDPTNVDIVYVATMGPNGTGLQRSIDGGASWTNITPTGLNTAVTEMELSSTGRLHIVCGYAGGYFSGLPSGYRYTDIPSTVTSGVGWTAPAVSFSSTDFNCDLAVGGTGSTLYALPANSSYQTNQVWKSTNGGANWAITTTTPPVGGSAPVSSGQAWYNLAIGVDPTNDNNVMVGGLNSYLSVNGGFTWTVNSVWVTGVPGSVNYIHADHHILVWNNNQVLDGGDGGLFYSGDDGATWSDRNIGLRLKQFYSVAVHPTTTNYFLGGTQDNGCHKLTSAGMGGSEEVTGGDGAFMHIDQDEPQYQFGSYVYSNYRRSTDGGTSWSAIDFGNGGQFINPTDYDDIVNKLYGPWTAGSFLRWNDPQSGSSANTLSAAAFNSALISATTVSPHTANRVFFGTDGGRVVRVNNANGVLTTTATNITGAGMPTSTVSCVAIGTSDNNLIATYSNYGSSKVWVTSNGGTNWFNITGDLQDIPVRWAMFHPDDNTKAILGTELGIFETLLINTGGTTNWVQDPNFPKVRVDMLQYRRSDGLLAAGTHGRGVWTAPLPFTQPYVHFAFNYNWKTEATTSTTGCRNYTDYTVQMRIDQAPTGTANITLTPAGGSTATQGVDYDFTTNGNFAAPSSTVTFASGSTTPVTITFRIYNDAELESLTEFVTLNYSIGGGTNAVASPGSSSYTFTIVENDVAPVAGTNAIATTAGTSRVEQVGNNGTYYFYSGTNIIHSLSGATLNLGCVSSSIFEAGNVWQSFQGGQRSQKVFDVAPATNPSAAYTIGLYFTAAELTGEVPNGLRIAKTTAATMAAANSSNTIIMPTPNPVAYGTGYVYTVTFTGFSKFFLVDAGVVLPVKLISFTGRLETGQIALNWKTSSEENSREFIVEKSPDGISWRPITRVLAAGNTFIEQHYNAIDKQVDEFNYYRLKMIDIDDKFDYSNVILIRNPGAQQDVRIGNNPFHSYIDIRFAKLPKQEIRMELYNMNGSLLIRKVYAAANQVRMDLSGASLAAGTYLLRTSVDGKQFTNKLVKQ